MPDRQAGADRLRQVRPEWRRRADCDPPYPSRQTVPQTGTSSPAWPYGPARATGHTATDRWAADGEQVASHCLLKESVFSACLFEGGLRKTARVAMPAAFWVGNNI